MPLDEPLPGFEHVQYQDSKSVKLFDAKITVLDTGLTVVTEPGIGEYCTLGLAIDAGPRYEAHYPLGVSHVIKKLAYNVSCCTSQPHFLARARRTSPTAKSPTSCCKRRAPWWTATAPRTRSCTPARAGWRAPPT